MPLSKSSRQWTGFRTILCAVDFSDQSRLALQYAEAVARRAHGNLHVVFANDPLLVAAAAAALHDRRLAKRSGAELKTFVDKTLGTGASQKLKVTTHSAVGHPRDVIPKTASRTRAELIVLGTQGLTGADRLVLGSTTLAVLQQTKVPVLAVPRPQKGQAPSASWPGGTIVAGIELDADAAADVGTAARIARSFDASLVLLHVVSTFAAPLWFEADLSGVEQARTTRAQQQLEKLAAAARRSVTTETRVIQGRVADEIASFVSTSGTGLLVTGLRDRTGWFGSSRGSVSYHVLSHSTVPVLAYPPRWRPR
jgi:nucleotide-binding universal stress UspA family protein